MRENYPRTRQSATITSDDTARHHRWGKIPNSRVKQLSWLLRHNSQLTADPLCNFCEFSLCAWRFTSCSTSTTGLDPVFRPQSFTSLSVGASLLEVERENQGISTTQGSKPSETEVLPRAWITILAV